MTVSLTEAERTALGLRDVCFGEEQFIPTSDVAGYGRSPVAAVALATLVATAHFSEWKIDPAERVGMRASVCDERTAVVRVVDSSGTAIHARSAQPGEGWLYRDVEDVGTAVVDLERAGAVSLARADGSGILIRLAPNGFAVQDFYGQGASITPLAPVRGPIELWLAECGDAWLANQLRLRANLDDSWQHAVAAGMGVRLAGLPADPTGYVEHLLAGQTSTSSPIREWARQLTDAQAETVADLALAVVDRIDGALGDLYDEMAPGEAWWCSSLHAVCAERDDLESARLILAERGAAMAPTAALDSLDAAGRRLVASIPRVVVLNDERLYRARLADPMAWWAQLAVPETEA
jgi:hypothetical protein